jgi:hypothetical protein
LWEYLICLKNKTLNLPVDILLRAWYYRQAVRETGREKNALIQTTSGIEQKKALDKLNVRC